MFSHGSTVNEKTQTFHHSAEQKLDTKVLNNLIIHKTTHKKNDKPDFAWSALTQDCISSSYSERSLICHKSKLSVCQPQTMNKNKTQHLSKWKRITETETRYISSSFATYHLLPLGKRVAWAKVKVLSWVFQNCSMVNFNN